MKIIKLKIFFKKEEMISHKAITHTVISNLLAPGVSEVVRYRFVYMRSFLSFQIEIVNNFCTFKDSTLSLKKFEK